MALQEAEDDARIAPQAIAIRAPMAQALSHALNECRARP